ncbi:MAG: glycosyltransferase family 4 protein [Rhodobacterales bacterium]|nr:glycosyltransferase family 4 protein [Rhodobacterales bacterium]
MKLLVINALSALQGGGQTYLINFLKHLYDADFKILLLVNSRNRGVFEKYTSDRTELYEAVWASKSIIHRTLWECLILPSFLTKQKADLYYAPGGIMTTKMPKGVTGVTALRNMLPFDERERKRFPLVSYIRFKLWLLHYVFLTSYKMADKVVFISEYSKSVVKDYIPNIDEKSVVTPHGLNSLFLNSQESYELPEYLTENKFYLYVSILDVYKAQKEIIEAWKILSDAGFAYPLVLVGPKYNEYGEEVVAMIDELGLQGKVIYLGKVDYEKLPGLYKSARALLFASSCECCPNILLEKLAAGKPVLCSNIEPMPEFGEDAVVYFDPYDPDTLVEQIRAMEEDQEKMKRLAEKAGKQALKFDWDQTVKKTVDFLFDNNKKEKNV